MTYEESKTLFSKNFTIGNTIIITIFTITDFKITNIFRKIKNIHTFCILENVSK